MIDGPTMADMAIPHWPNAMIFVIAIGFVVALALFLSARVRRRSGRILSLQDAAVEAYESAKRKGLVIATVADRAGAKQNAIAWFMQSIAGVVPTYRKRNGRFDKVNPSGTLSESGTLHILKRDLAAYLRWARSVQ